MIEAHRKFFFKLTAGLVGMGMVAGGLALWWQYGLDILVMDAIRYCF